LRKKIKQIGHQHKTMSVSNESYLQGS